MKGAVTVAGAAAAPSSAPSTPVSGAAAAPQPDPNAPKYTLFDPVAPKVMSGKVHDVDFPIIEKDITVAEGFVVHAWTFGGTVPGPTLRVHLGDTVNVHLTNQGQMSHSIDFHASQTAMNNQMVEIAPGSDVHLHLHGRLRGRLDVPLRHRADAPPHRQRDVRDGDRRAQGRPVRRSTRRSRWSRASGTSGTRRSRSTTRRPTPPRPRPDFVVFNGVANQYKDNPIMVTTKGRVRAFVLNVGPNVDSSFHTVGTIFDTVIKEGIVLAKGNAGGWGSQAVDLAPAQGAVIEFSPQEDGMYPFVTHAFNFVGRGAVGIFMAGDGDPKN